MNLFRKFVTFSCERVAASDQTDRIYLYNKCSLVWGKRFYFFPNSRTHKSDLMVSFQKISDNEKKIWTLFIIAKESE